MARQILLLPFLLFMFGAAYIYANPYPPPPLDSDYLRGTFGEPLSIDDAYVLEKFDFRVENEFRYSEYTGFWDEAGRKQDLRDWLYVDYSRRVVNFLSIDFGFSDNVAIGARIPYLWVNLNQNLDWAEEISRFSNDGIGDFLLRVKVNPLGVIGVNSGPARVALSAGVKFPSGEYQEWYLPTGSGSVDFSFMGYAGSDLRIFELHAGLGYVVTGKNKYNESLGDIFFYDIAITRALASHLSWVVEFSGHTITATKNWNGLKFNDGRLKINDGQDRFTVSPGIRVTIPSANLKIGGGFSYDLFGMNAFRRSGPFLRMSLNRRLKL